MIPLLLAFWFAPQEKPVEKATLSGTVVNSVTGEPLGKVIVLAEPMMKGPAASTTTDAKGHFELVDLEPGNYRVKGQRNGYVETYYGARRAEGKGTAIALDPGQQWKDLQLKLMPRAVIAGTVRDSDGEPLAGATISLISLAYNNGRRVYSVETDISADDLGQYRASVPPGRYYVRGRAGDGEDPPNTVDHSAKNARPPEILLPAIYPGVQEITAARPLVVEAGSRFNAIDITLPRSRVFRVRVHVDGPAGLTPSVGLSSGPSGLRGQLRAEKKGNGNFEFHQVPPGSYTLTANASPPERPFRGVIDFNGDPGYESAMPLDVGSADVDGIRIAVAPGAEVTGHITVEGENPPKLAAAVIHFTNAQDRGREVWMGEENRFHTRLSHGRYEVFVDGAEGLFLKSVRSGDADVLSEGLNISEPGNVAIEIVMSADGGRVDGVVLDKDDKPAPGATIVLIPDSARRGRWNLFLTSTADQYGRYELKTVPPGEYKVFAWDDVEPGVWFDPDFLRNIEKLGEAVTVTAKGHATARLHVVLAP